jgi:DNA-binding transcriptional LysR family regulator
MIDPNDLALFARVAEAGSFTKAAERLKLPKSTVSRRLSALETQLGERLLQRTTRKLTLTEFGQALLDHARQVVAEVDAVAALAMHRQAQPSGRLRVTAPADFAPEVMPRVLAEFIERYPAITLEMDLTPRRVDLISEGFDVALRMGELADDSQLAARRLVSMTTGLYAAPALLARQGEPVSPEALPHMDGLLVLSRTGEPMPWKLTRGEERWQGLPMPRAVINAPAVLLKLACEGCGIVATAEMIAEPHVKSGALVRVLPQWCLAPVDAWAVFPGRRLMPAKTRVFVDAVTAGITGACEVAERRRQAEAQAA